MRHWPLLSIVILLGFLMVSAVPAQERSYLKDYGYKGGRGQGYRMLPYQVSEKVHTCVQGKINGRITLIKAESFSQGMEPGLGMDIQTSDRGMVHVHLGPLWFLERQEHDLKPGDEVTIQAFCYTFAEQERVIAGEVTHKDHTLVLRDPQGVPYWDAWRKK